MAYFKMKVDEKNTEVEMLLLFTTFLIHSSLSVLSPTLPQRSFMILLFEPAYLIWQRV